MINAKDVKERIILYLDRIGPSLPVRIAKEVGLNTIFASAFLSELASEGSVKISHMKVGGSPLYYTLSKEIGLENFLQNLNQKEREACLMLKQQGFLKDENQTPVIRVALRSIKDFALPIKLGDKLFWRYYLFKGDIDFEGKNKLEKPLETTQSTEIITEKISEPLPIPENTSSEVGSSENKEVINSEKTSVEIMEVKEVKKIKKKILPGAFLEETLGKIKEKGYEVVEVENSDKKFVIVKVKKEGKELLLFSFDKKRIDEKELMKAYKKSNSIGLSYAIMLREDLPKKMKETIEVYKYLSKIEKL